jgi:hypothetical protein
MIFAREFRTDSYPVLHGCLISLFRETTSIASTIAKGRLENGRRSVHSSRGLLHQLTRTSDIKLQKKIATGWSRRLCIKDTKTDHLQGSI